MYPPLCYLDLVQRQEPEKGQKNAKPASFLIIDEGLAQELPVKVRFLVVDKVRDGVKKIRDTVAPILQALKP